MSNTAGEQDDIYRRLIVNNLHLQYKAQKWNKNDRTTLNAFPYVDVVNKINLISSFQDELHRTLASTRRKIYMVFDLALTKEYV